MKIIIGLLLLAAGMGYLYRPNTVMKLNEWIKKHIFNDQILIHHRRKIGLAMLLLGFLLLYFGVK